ncbi:uncharacterized protein O3C94_019852 [Discoglossus pictus]
MYTDHELEQRIDKLLSTHDNITNELNQVDRKLKALHYTDEFERRRDVLSYVKYRNLLNEVESELYRTLCELISFCAWGEDQHVSNNYNASVQEQPSYARVQSCLVRKISVPPNLPPVRKGYGVNEGGVSVLSPIDKSEKRKGTSIYYLHVNTPKSEDTWLEFLIPSNKEEEEKQNGRKDECDTGKLEIMKTPVEVLNPPIMPEVEEIPLQVISTTRIKEGYHAIETQRSETDETSSEVLSRPIIPKDKETPLEVLGPLNIPHIEDTLLYILCPQDLPEIEETPLEVLNPPIMPEINEAPLEGMDTSITPQITHTKMEYFSPPITPDLEKTPLEFLKTPIIYCQKISQNTVSGSPMSVSSTVTNCISIWEAFILGSAAGLLLDGIDRDSACESWWRQREQRIPEVLEGVAFPYALVRGLPCGLGGLHRRSLNRTDGCSRDEPVGDIICAFMWRTLAFPSAGESVQGNCTWLKGVYNPHPLFKAYNEKCQLEHSPIHVVEDL